MNAYRLMENIQHLVTKGLLVAGLATSVVGLGCSTNAAQNPHAGAPQGMPVKVLEAKAMPVDDATEYVATMKSRDSAVIMPQVEGQITQILVHSGDRVEAGTPMIEIDPLKQQATVKSQESARAAQEANLIWAKKQYERSQGLSAAGVVSKQDLDQAKSALDAAQAQMDSLDSQVREQEVQLHYYRVFAPRSGIVGDIPVRVGDRVTTTTQLTTVDLPGSLEAYVYVPIEHSAQLKMGLPVQVIDGDGKVLADSRVSFISPQVDNTTQTVLVKALILMRTMRCGSRSLFGRGWCGGRIRIRKFRSWRCRGWGGSILRSWPKRRMAARSWRGRSRLRSDRPWATTMRCRTGSRPGIRLSSLERSFCWTGRR